MTTTEEMIQKASERPEYVWKWGIYLDRGEIGQVAADLGMTLQWGVPIRPGDLYLAKRNTGPHLLECSFLGEACVHPTTLDYAFDFSECVKVREEMLGESEIKEQ